MPKFSDLGLSAKVIQAVEEAGYTEPTPIQAGAIPHVLQQKDVLGIAQTGTGKTASFVLPMLTLLEQGRARARMPRTLILEPTRELAAQVEENFSRYGKNQRLNISLLIGGVSFDDQERKLERGADVLIATPGRLLDHFERGKLLLNAVEILVIDEADRMLDMGFIPDIERICKLLPFTRQTLFFSATMPPEITGLTEQFLHSPVRIEIARESSTAKTVSQKLVKSLSKPWDKRARLRDLIVAEDENLKNAIIFCNRKRDVSELFRSLVRHGFDAGALHGDMDQRARTTMLTNFREGKLKLLVASDVAARGLDIPDVSHVFNYDVPIHAEDYVHRIGRTGRAGRSGKTFMLVTRAETKQLAAIERMIGEQIEWLDGDLESLNTEQPEEQRGKKSSNSRNRGNKNARDKSAAPRKNAGHDAGARNNTVAHDESVVVESHHEAAKPTPAPSEETEAKNNKRAPRKQRSNKSTAPADDKAATASTPVSADVVNDTDVKAEKAVLKPVPNRAPVNKQTTDRQPHIAAAPANQGKRPNNRREKDDAPIGFGDAIPDFMLIPTNMKAKKK